MATSLDLRTSPKQKRHAALDVPLEDDRIPAAWTLVR